MSLDKRIQIKELYELKHRNDNLANEPFDIENEILNNTTTPFLYQNNNMANFLDKFKDMLFMMYDNVNILRNLKNFMVNKHYNKHIH